MRQNCLSSQHCHNKQKMPSIAVKIDFAKAFNTVHWDGLLRVLQARGFSSKWRDWVLHLLSSTRSAILGPSRHALTKLIATWRDGKPACLMQWEERF
jgi:hypothetical protein